MPVVAPSGTPAVIVALDPTEKVAEVPLKATARACNRLRWPVHDLNPDLVPANAMHAGVAPLQASSGAFHRHRLNRRGNRQLNAALPRIVITQMRIHEPAKSFIARKRAEGISNREALR